MFFYFSPSFSDLFSKYAFDSLENPMFGKRMFGSGFFPPKVKPRNVTVILVDF